MSLAGKTFNLLNSAGKLVGKIPAIGFGTFQPDPSTPRGTVRAAVLEAIRLGYRHIDTAFSYGLGEVEREVGEAIRECGVERRELFVVTKLHNPFHHPDDVKVGFEMSRRNLGLDYVDLYLMHFPHAYVPIPETYDTLRGSDGKPVIDVEMSRRYTDTYKAMEELVYQGKTKFIGLSNFSILKTRRILEMATVHPVVNQVELHPYLPQRRLLEFCKSRHIHLTAHSPLGGAPVAVVASGEPGPLTDPLIHTLAQKYNVPTSQILLSWALQRGTSIIPKSNKPERIASNFKAGDLELDEADVERIDMLKGEGDSIRMNDPKRWVGVDIYNEEVDRP